MRPPGGEGDPESPRDRRCVGKSRHRTGAHPVRHWVGTGRHPAPRSCPRCGVRRPRRGRPRAAHRGRAGSIRNRNREFRWVRRGRDCFTGQHRSRCVFPRDLRRHHVPDVLAGPFARVAQPSSLHAGTSLDLARDGDTGPVLGGCGFLPERVERPSSRVGEHALARRCRNDGGVCLECRRHRLPRVVCGVRCRG